MAAYVQSIGTTTSSSVANWSVDDVAELLNSIGLSHKVDTIKQHNVTGSKLSTMTDTDLTAIGFSGLQIRKIRKEVPLVSASASAAFATTTPKSGDGTSGCSGEVSSFSDTQALKQELDTLKAQVASLTASLDRIKMITSQSNLFPQSTSSSSSPSNAPSHSIHVPGFCHDCWIEGNQAQILTVVMGPGDVVQADKGSMVHMSSYIKMSTTTGGQGFGRFITGQSIFLTEYTYHGPQGTADKIAFTPDFSGQIIPLDMGRYGNHVVCQKSSLLASSVSVSVSVEFSGSLGAGFFGGEGCLRGHGHAFLTARGTIITMVLRPGEQRLVSTGCIVGFEASVKYDVVTTGGLGNMLLSGEGVFHTRLTGPGTIWLESQDMSRLFKVLNNASSGPGLR